MLAELEEAANALKDKFAGEVKGEEAASGWHVPPGSEKAGAKIVQTGFVTGSDQIPGLPGRQANLANACDWRQRGSKQSGVFRYRYVSYI